MRRTVAVYMQSYNERLMQITERSPFSNASLSCIAHCKSEARLPALWSTTWLACRKDPWWCSRSNLVEPRLPRFRHHPSWIGGPSSTRHQKYPEWHWWLRWSGGELSNRSSSRSHSCLQRISAIADCFRQHLYKQPFMWFITPSFYYL